MATDWIRTLSIELSRQIIHDPDLSGAKVEALIREHFSGAAYMPVPRCETCVHWRPIDLKMKRGECVNAETIKLGQIVLITPRAFGCIQWKEK